MKAIRFAHTLIIAAVLALGAAPAQAALINITHNGTSLVGDVSKKTLGDNSPGTSFDWLAGEGDFDGHGIVEGYKALTGAYLPVPLFENFFDAGDSQQVDITGFSYAVLHYGVGKGGKKGSGGGIVAYFLENLTGEITLPGDGLGPNGFGGLSSVRLFKAEQPPHHVPDSGATALMIAASLAGLGWISNRKK